eukprot:676908-Pyramimonas_sp.AAC.1
MPVVGGCFHGLMERFMVWARAVEPCEVHDVMWTGNISRQELCPAGAADQPIPSCLVLHYDFNNLYDDLTDQIVVHD